MLRSLFPEGDAVTVVEVPVAMNQPQPSCVPPLAQVPVNEGLPMAVLKSKGVVLQAFVLTAICWLTPVPQSVTGVMASVLMEAKSIHKISALGKIVFFIDINCFS